MRLKDAVKNRNWSKISRLEGLFKEALKLDPRDRQMLHDLLRQNQEVSKESSELSRVMMDLLKTKYNLAPMKAIELMGGGAWRLQEALDKGDLIKPEDEAKVRDSIVKLKEVARKTKETLNAFSDIMIDLGFSGDQASQWIRVSPSRLDEIIKEN